MPPQSARSRRRPTRAGNRLFRATVIRTAWISPTLRRITLTAPELATFQTLGFDDYIGVVIPPSGSTDFVLPDSANPAALRLAIAALPEQVRPDLRWYTVRHHRAFEREIDIDFVTHGVEGPGTRFALAAKPGVVLGLRECAALYAPPHTLGSQLLIGDESSQPAIARIIELTPPRALTTAVIELPDMSSRIEMNAPTTWVVRREKPGDALEQAIRALSLSSRPEAIWLCAEQRGVKAIRRYLAEELQIPKPLITFSGYWRLGEPRL